MLGLEKKALLGPLGVREVARSLKDERGPRVSKSVQGPEWESGHQCHFPRTTIKDE